MFFGVTAIAIAFWELIIYCVLTTVLEGRSRWQHLPLETSVTDRETTYANSRD